jgi:hypothetical protein
LRRNRGVSRDINSIIFHRFLLSVSQISNPLSCTNKSNFTGVFIVNFERL